MWWDSPQWEKVESFFNTVETSYRIMAPPPYWLHDDWGVEWGGIMRELALGLGADPAVFDAAWAEAVVVSRAYQRPKS